LVITGTALYIIHLKNNQETGVLKILDTYSGFVYGKWPLENNGEFVIEFIHSVNKSPVRETFLIKQKMILPKEVRFYSFGAGMQSDLGEDQILNYDGDAMIISGFNTAYKELNYIVGTVSDHVLFINSEIISLRELAEKSAVKHGERNAHITIRYR
jgi:hypothetical protein